MAEGQTLQVTVKVSDQGLVSFFDAAGKKVAQFGSEIDKATTKTSAAGSSFSSLGAKLISLNQGLDLAGKAFGLAKSGVEAFMAGIDRADAIRDMSQRLGVSVSTLSAFELAAKAGGTSLEGLGQSFKFLSRNLAEAASGNKELAAAFKAMGIDAATALKDPAEAMLKLSDAFSQATDDGNKTAMALKLLGRSGAEAIPFLNQGREEIQRFVDLSQKLGAVLTDDVANAADAFNDNLAVMGTAVTGVQTQLAAGMLPSLERLTDRLVDFAAQAGIGDGTIQAFGQSVGEMAEKLGVAAINAVDGFANRVKEVGFADAVNEALAGSPEKVRETAEWLGGEIASSMIVGIGKRMAEGAYLITKAITDAVAGQSDADKFQTPQLVMTAEPTAAHEQIRQMREEMRAAALAAEDAGAQMTRLESPIQSVGEATKSTAASTDVMGKHSLPTLSGAASAGADAVKALAVELEKLTFTSALWSQAADGSISYESALLRVAAAQKAAGQEGANAKTQELALAVVRETSISKTLEEAAKLEANAKALDVYSDTLAAAVAAHVPLEKAKLDAAAASDKFKVAQLAEAVGTDTAREAAEKHATAMDADAAAVERRAETDLRATLDAEADSLSKQTAIMQAAVSGAISYEQALHDLAVAEEKVALAAKEPGLSGEALYEMAEAAVLAQDEFDAIKTQFEDLGDKGVAIGEQIGDAFSDTLKAIASGTQDVGDIWESFGINLAASLFDNLWTEKLGFDELFKGNLLDLAGSAASLFTTVGGGAVSLLGGVVSLLGGSSVGGSLVNLGTSLVGLAGGSSGSGAIGLLTSGSKLLGGGSLLNSAISLYRGGTGLLGGLFYNPPTMAGYTGAGGYTGFENVPGSYNWGGIYGGFGGGLGALGGSYLANAIGIGPRTSTARLAAGIGGGVGGTLAGAYAGGAMGAAVSGMLGVSGALASTGVGAVVGAVVAIIATVLGAAFEDYDTKGTLARKAGQKAIERLETFDTLEDTFGRVSRKANTISNAPWIPANRERFGSETMSQIEGFSTVFTDMVFGKDAWAGSRLGGAQHEWSNILVDFFGRFQGDAEEVSAAIKETLRDAFSDLGIETAPEAFEWVNKAATAIAAAKEYFAWFKEPVDPFKNLGASVRGIADIFEDDLPIGVHVAAAALQVFEKDGQKAAGTLSGDMKDSLLDLSQDAERFDAVVGELFKQGFQIDTEELENTLADITASAEFLGAELTDSLINTDSVSAAIDDMMATLTGEVQGQVLDIGLTKLFDTTRIAESFQPVFAKVRELKDGVYDALDPASMATFKADLTTAIAEGRANLSEYLPQLRALVAAAKEIDAAIEEAFEPTPIQKFYDYLKTTWDAAGVSIRDSLGSSIRTALSEGTGITGVTDALKEDLKSSLQDALIDAFVDAAIIEGALQPLIVKMQVAISAAMQDGVLDAGEAADIEKIFGEGLTAVDTLVTSLSPSLERLLGIATETSTVAEEAGDKAFKTGKEWSDWFSGKAGDLAAVGDSALVGGEIVDDVSAAFTSLSGSLTEDDAAAIGRGMDELRGAVEKENLASSFESAAGAAVSLEDAFTSLSNTLGALELPGAARGGIFGSGMAIVGEAGPEIAWAIPGGGFGVRPVSSSAARTLLGRGARGMAAGGVVSGAVDYQQLLNASRAARSSDEETEAAFAISLDLSQALRDLARSSDMDAFTSTLTEQINGAVYDGFISALNDPEISDFGRVTEGFEKDLGDAIKKAFEDGVADAEDIQGIRDLADKYKGYLEYELSKIQPALDALEDSFGSLQAFETVRADLTLSLNAAVEDFARGGSVEDLGRAINDEMYNATLTALVDAMLASEVVDDALDEFRDGVQKAIDDGLEAGVVDTDAIAALGDSLSMTLIPVIEALGPTFGSLASAFGQKLGSTASSVGDVFRSSIDAAFREGQSYADFTAALRQDLFVSVRDGLIDAFIDSAIVQGALAPMLTAIEGIFDQIAKKQLTMAEASVLLAEQTALMKGILDDEAFKSGFDSTIDAIKDIAKSLDVAAFETRELATSTASLASAAQDVTDAYEDTREEQFQWLLETLELGFAQVNTFGRGARVGVERYMPRLAAGGLVTRPTVALLGEAGPEVVTPLRHFDSSLIGGSSEQRHSYMTTTDTGVRDQVAALRGDLRRLAKALESRPTAVSVTVDQKELITAMARAKRVARKASYVGA